MARKNIFGNEIAKDAFLNKYNSDYLKNVFGTRVPKDTYTVIF